MLFAAFGLRDAITPIISFNYGLKDPKRIKDGMKFGLLYTFVIMIVCLAALEVFAAPLTGLFSLSDQTKDLCITAMRVVPVSFIFAGANIAFQGIFQALGGGIESLVLSLLRQLIFVLPVAWAFAVWAPRYRMDYIYYCRSIDRWNCLHLYAKNICKKNQDIRCIIKTK